MGLKLSINKEKSIAEVRPFGWEIRTGEGCLPETGSALPLACDSGHKAAERGSSGGRELQPDEGQRSCPAKCRNADCPG